MNASESTKGFRKKLSEICSRKDFPNNRQNVHTPYELCQEMIDRLEKSTELHDKNFLTMNLEFVEVLIYDYGVDRTKIWCIIDCSQKAIVLEKHERYQGVNVVLGDFLKWKPNMKFDVIVGNPPYQTKSSNDNRKTQAIWPEFVVKCTNSIKENGYLCLVHPSGWRDVDGMFKNVQRALLSKQLIYLEMHQRADGVKLFGVQTTYDWYVLQNKHPISKTFVKWQDGSKSNVDLSVMGFIPNGMFDEISSLIARNREKKCSLLRDASRCHTQKSWMSETNNNKHKYPCVYSTLKDGTVKCWYSNVKNGFFGTPKVIFTDGTSYPIIDFKGEYGLTQFAYGISDSPHNLVLIQKAMLTNKFIQLMDTCQFRGKHRYNRKVIGTFKKDFWKHFVDDDGDEI